MMTITITPPGGTGPISAKAEAALDEALDVVGKYAMERISFHAGTKLHTSHLDYQHGLQDARSYIKTPGMLTITLVGKLPNMLEKGFTAFDIKVGLLGSSKVKTGKNGSRYIDVPFRWGKPGTTTMQAMSKSTSSAIDAQLRAAATSTAGVAGRVRTKARTPGAMHLVGGGQGRIRNRAGVQDQMTRITAPYQKTVQSQYRTFRRVSLASRAKSWIHPGHIGINAFAAAKQDIQRDIPRIVHDFLKRAGVSV